MISFPAHTRRLDLDPLAAGDQDAFVSYRQDPAVARWQSWTPDYSAADAADLIARQPQQVKAGSGSWMQIAIRDSHTGVLLGDAAIHALAEQPDTYELGITVATAAQGKGVASEALRALALLLFRDQAAHRLIATTDARNASAARLFERLGFRHEGRAIEADWFKDEWTTVDNWALLHHEVSKL